MGQIWSNRRPSSGYLKLPFGSRVLTAKPHDFGDQELLNIPKKYVSTWVFAAVRLLNVDVTSEFLENIHMMISINMGPKMEGFSNGW